MRRLLVWWWVAGCGGADEPGDSGGDAEGRVDVDSDGFSVEEGDCDDLDSAIVPGADELCDGVDQDCNGTVDDAPVDGAIYYVDDDGDGYGTDDRTLVSCARPEGYAEEGGDCDDAEAAVNPRAIDTLDEDRNCDGQFGVDTDEGVITSSDASCVGNTVTLTATATGPVDQVRWFMTDNGNVPAWSENHDLNEDAAGFWSRELEAIVEVPDQQPNVSTLFGCQFIDSPWMTYVAGAFDYAGNQLDCVVWGADPAGVLNGSNQGANPPDPAFDLDRCIVH